MMNLLCNFIIDSLFDQRFEMRKLYSSMRNILSLTITEIFIINDGTIIMLRAHSSHLVINLYYKTRYTR